MNEGVAIEGQHEASHCPLADCDECSIEADVNRLATALKAQGSDKGWGWHVLNCQPPKECLARCVIACTALRKHSERGEGE